MNTWVLVWLIVLPAGPVEFQDVPARTFPTESACRQFAFTHNGIAHVFARNEPQCRKVVQT
jgi:hypothetical protein